MKAKIGMITIGQSPRTDVTPDLVGVWRDRVDIIQKGALDGLTLEEIQKMGPEEGDYTLVTRLKDGTQVIIGKKHILPKVREKVRELNEEEVDVILLLCTGEFPEMESKILIIKPQEVLHKTVAAIAGKNKIGVLTPLPEQTEQAREKWLSSGVNAEIAWGSPYGEEEIILRGIRELSGKNISLIVMDCMGYTWDMKQKAKKLTDKPVILPRTLIARVIDEMIS